MCILTTAYWPTGEILCLRQSRSLPPQSLSATTTPTTTNNPLGGSPGAFPPSLTTTPLPLLLQKELAAGCQCHCRQCRHFPSEMAEQDTILRN
ncbi:MAG: hypothetical protein J0L63_20240 [Anaerolineae bacterium]|nr:hypothetical protein [Anaerolineae bacterium]